MTTADATRTVDLAAAAALRTRVRAVLEEEYLQLSCVDRPALHDLRPDAAEDGIDPGVLAGELEVLDNRVATLHDHLAALVRDPAGPARGRVVMIDAGEGPELAIVLPVNVTDPHAIAADSPLGRALVGAIPGVVSYTLPNGQTACVRLLAVEEPALTRHGPVEARMGWGATGLVDGAAQMTAVIPSRPQAVAHGKVVVGLRHARGCERALAVGFTEARRRNAELAVLVIRDDAVPADDGLTPAFHVPDDRDVEEADLLPAVVATVARAFPTVRVRTQLQTGAFAEVLIELAHTADVVVLGLGPRPSGMGRSDLAVAGHASCPVIVVREGTRGEVL